MEIIHLNIPMYYFQHSGQFYQENYPDIVIEKGGIDEVIMMMIRGEA